MDSDVPSAGIGTTVPARIRNCRPGGMECRAADKEAGGQFAQPYPGISGEARAPRYFITRVARHLAGERTR